MPADGCRLEARLDDVTVIRWSVTMAGFQLCRTATLDDWSIDFFVFTQKPGNLITMNYQAYYCAWSSSATDEVPSVALIVGTALSLERRCGLQRPRTCVV
jgi:hypothetical protein